MRLIPVLGSIDSTWPFIIWAFQYFGAAQKFPSHIRSALLDPSIRLNLSQAMDHAIAHEVLVVVHATIVCLSLLHGNEPPGLEFRLLSALWRANPPRDIVWLFDGLQKYLTSAVDRGEWFADVYIRHRLDGWGKVDAYRMAGRYVGTI